MAPRVQRQAQRVNERMNYRCMQTHSMARLALQAHHQRVQKTVENPPARQCDCEPACIHHTNVTKRIAEPSP